MKKTAIFAAIVCLFAVGIFAQSKPDYSGAWKLDKEKSKLDERSRIEEMALKVTHTATTIEVETKTKRAPRPEGAPQGEGNRGGGGGMRGGMMGGGDNTTLYAFDKETVKETETERGKIQTKLNADLQTDGKLILSSARTFNTPNGEMTMTVKETWELTEGGKILKVKRESQSMRGTQTMEMVFVKN